MGETEQHAALLQQAQQTVRRAKRALTYTGWETTNDFVNALMLKWVKSGEYAELVKLPPRRRKLDRSARAAIIDEFRSHNRQKRSCTRVALDDVPVANERQLYDTVESQVLRQWLMKEIDLLKAGTVDRALDVELVAPEQVGFVLEHIAKGQTQRQIAKHLGVSVGTINQRHRTGLLYLGLRAQAHQLKLLEE